MQILDPEIGSNTLFKSLLRLKSGNILSSGERIILDGKDLRVLIVFSSGISHKSDIDVMQLFENETL